MLLLPSLYKLFFVVLVSLHWWKQSITVIIMSPYISVLCISHHISLIAKVQQMIAILLSTSWDQY